MDEAKIIDGLKIVCKCKNVPKRVFLAHIAGDVRTLEKLQQLTGAGSGDCKGKRCTAQLLELLRSQETCG